MRLFDASGTERFEAPSGIGGTSSLAFSPDGSILAAGSWDTNLRAWNTRNGELLGLIEELPVAMFGIAFSPDGRTLATAGVDRILYLWDSKTWKLTRKFVGQPEMISALAYSPDGRYIATGGFNDITQAHPVSILIWDLSTGKSVRTLPAPHRVSSVAFSPDGSLLAAAAGDKNVRLWKVR
jgi:WD40 repeat protein